MPYQPRRRTLAKALRLDTNTLANSGLAFIIVYSVMYLVSRI